MIRSIIALEGGDGCGKKTQSNRLITNLRLYLQEHEKHHLGVIRFQLPNYDSESSILVKKYLSGDFPKTDGFSGIYAASLAFAIDRYLTWNSPIPDSAWENFCDAYETDNEHLTRSSMISYAELYNHPASYGFSDGIIIIADRYVDSNKIYQGARIIEDLVKSQYHKYNNDEFRKICMEAMNNGAFLSYMDWIDDLELNRLQIPSRDNGLNVIYLCVSEEISKRNMQRRYHGKDELKDIHEKDDLLQFCVRLISDHLVDQHYMTSIRCYEGSLMRPVDQIENDVMEFAVKTIL